MRLSPQLRTGTTRTKRWITALLGTAVTTATLVPVLAAAPASAATVDRTSASAFTTNDVLPFDMPSAAAAGANGKLVFAHYMPSLPLSLDNADPANDYYARNYLKPTGESGKHAAYGGFLRDRPLPVAKQGADYKLRNFELEIRQAKSAGIDGFSVDLLSINKSSPLYENEKLLVQAAKNVGGFTILLMPDMTAGGKSATPQTLAAAVADIASAGAAHKLSDGRLVVSPFHADSRDAGWWKDFLSVMKNQHGQSVAFMPLSLDERTSLSSFKSIAYGISNWGSRNPSWNNPAAGSVPMTRAKNVENLGLKWMQPVSAQDERPNQGIYDEAENTTNLRNTWAIARNSGADWVQIPTWNDYTEGSHIAPSVDNGWGWLDINSYYTAWYKTGTAPAIKRDTVYVTHRTQSVSAKQTTPQSKTMRNRGGSAPRDTVEALTFLTAPGTVTVTVGNTKHTCEVDAGVDTCVVPLGTGAVSAAVSRSGRTVAAVTSAKTVTNSPSVQDFHYVAASSRREGSTQTVVETPAPTTSTTPPATPAPTVPASPRPTTPAPPQNTTPTTPTTPTTKPSTQPATGGTSTTLFPIADTYANEGAPSTVYGSDPLLVSRTGPGATAFLRFDLPAAPAGKKLTGATLRVHTAADAMSSSANEHLVRLGSNSWKEASLTWKNKTPMAGVELGKVPAGAKVNSSYDVPLTIDPLSPVLGKTQTIGIQSLGADSLWLWSKENSDKNLRPQLILTFS